jgi:hypothetical protein
MTAGEVRIAMEALPDADLDTILGAERPLILAPMRMMRAWVAEGSSQHPAPAADSPLSLSLPMGQCRTPGRKNIRPSACGRFELRRRGKPWPS